MSFNKGYTEKNRCFLYKKCHFLSIKNLVYLYFFTRGRVTQPRITTQTGSLTGISRALITLRQWIRLPPGLLQQSNQRNIQLWQETAYPTWP